MRMPVTLLMAIGRVALKHAGVGYVDDAFEIARLAWREWNKTPKEPKERRAEIAAVVAADDEQVRIGVDEVVAEVAGGEPEEARKALAAFITQVPERIRQAQRRPDDPTGRTVREGFVLEEPEDLLPFLPDRLPRFRPGDRPLPGVDWELAELLGMGGFGEVWKARHAHFGDSFAPVALKFGTDLEPQTRQRLLTYEAKVCARVMEQGRHPGIVALQQTYLSADPPCLQYEFVEGGDIGGLIRDWHRPGHKPTADLVARAVLQIAEVVAFTHRLQPHPIVHRDLKPANILVQRVNGGLRFRITDFGIGGIATARAVQATRQLTATSQFMTTAVRGSCTMLYASPEQLRGSDPDPRDDVHALGVIWFQMLTGDLTRGRPGGAGWRKKIPGLSPAQADLLESCFEDQDDRPADAGVLADGLRALLNESSPLPPGEGGRRPGEGGQPEADAAMRPHPAAARPPSPGGRGQQAAPAPPPEIVNSVGMKLKLIPAGEFDMGSPDNDSEAQADEKPRHRVKITRPFYLGVYPVTQGEYQKATGKAPSHFKGSDRLPVESVTWFDAVACANALSQKENLPPFYRINGETVEVPDWHGKGYRLPTEAEWEYACRAGSEAKYCFGDDPARLPRHAWFDTNAAQKTHAVGEKAPNAFGLHDTHGNVWEWCWDWYDAECYQDVDYKSKNNKEMSANIDPTGPTWGDARVLRGGGWGYVASGLRSACRGRIAPAARFDCYGFRLARTYH